jgi:hypothetical protein
MSGAPRRENCRRSGTDLSNRATGHASVGNNEREKEAELCTSCQQIRFFEKHPVVYPEKTHSLADSGIDVHIDPDSLIRNDCERLRLRAERPVASPCHVQDVIARW